MQPLRRRKRESRCEKQPPPASEGRARASASVPWETSPRAFQFLALACTQDPNPHGGFPCCESTAGVPVLETRADYGTRGPLPTCSVRQNVVSEG